MLATRAHHDSGVNHSLAFVADGAEALEYLRRYGRYADRTGASHPGLILLDLNMPGMGAHETLSILKSEPLSRRLPVVVLSTSSSRRDIASSYDGGANS